MKMLALLLLLTVTSLCTMAQGPGNIRWYSLHSILDYYQYNHALNNHAHYLPIWEDSTVLHQTDTGLAPVQYSAYYQLIDPITSPIFNDPSFTNEIVISRGDDYDVDSVAIWGAYLRVPNRPTSIVDTLIISVVPIIPYPYRPYNRLQLTKALQPNINWYTSKDSLFAFSPYFVDTEYRAALPDTSSPLKHRALIKIPLTDADADSITTSILPPKVYGFTPLKIPRGAIFAVTVTFKSGDSWVKNVTEIDSMHHFMPVVSYLKPDTAMPYYYESIQEVTTHGYMLTSDPSSFVPAIFLEANSSPKFKHEFNMLAAHVDCHKCIVNVKEKNTPEPQILDTYPNPSLGVVGFYLKERKQKEYSLTIINSYGRKVTEVSITDKYYWDTNALPKGIFHYILSEEGKAISSGSISVL